MTTSRPRRAWAAAATLIAIALAGFASVATAAVQTLVGVDRVTFAWQPATGQPNSYLVSRSLNGGPLQSYSITSGTQITMPAAPGDQIQIAVRAFAPDSTGAFQLGPSSPLSELVSVLPAPQFVRPGRWLLHCKSCPTIESRWLSDASVVAETGSGLPDPWVVLGHAKLGGVETIIWHNRQTGALTLWDWASLTPIGIEPTLTSTALRGVGSVDLDRDGSEEFLIQRTDTLIVSAWSLTESGFRRVAQLSGPTGAILTEARDFDTDGRVDLLWHDPAAGTVDLARFLMNPVLGAPGTVVSLNAPLLNRVASGIYGNAQVASTGDYDADGSRDVLIRYFSGALAILYLNKGAPDDFVRLPSASDDFNRVVVGSRNVNERPGAEIALQHRPTGEISLLDPLTGQRIAVLSAGSKWEAVGLGM